MQEKIKKLIRESTEALGYDVGEIFLEHPDEISHGDFSTNVALKLSGPLSRGNFSNFYEKNSSFTVGRPLSERSQNPRALAEEIVRYIVQNQPKEITKIEVAGPGFINFYLSRRFFTESVAEISASGENFGKNSTLVGKKIMVDYTDPNPFKEFHIGHLMSNAIGESLCRIFEETGATVVRVCYQGDVGLHVAKAVWGMTQRVKSLKLKVDSLKIKDWGEAYAVGSEAYETDDVAKKEIVALNKIIFDKSDAEINRLYETGRRASLEHFEEIYKKLGTKFDYIIPESSVIEDGQKIVREFLERGVFEKSDGAVVFRGENHGLHTRVFINSQGLPTYETKDIGLAKKKIGLEKKLDASIIITANEQNDYFKVVFKALEFIFPAYAKISRHIGHGMLRLPSGKMSSRKGNVVTGESLISAVEAMVHKKLEERELETFEKNKIAEAVAIGAVKYSILRQAIGSDIIFDFEKSISFEGDSGPYLQYSYVRAKSVLAKAEKEEIKPAAAEPPRDISVLEKLLYRFPEVVERAGAEYAPHLIATYLIELAGAFNGFYAKNKILDAGDATPYRLALTRAFSIVMKNGLWLLGIVSPDRM